MLDRRAFLRTTAAGLAGAYVTRCAGGGGASGGAGGDKPNVIVILADDLGYADLSCQGCVDWATPNIDALAASGVRFTDGYVSAPVCSPTRAGIMTGRYQQRFGHELNVGGTPAPGSLAWATVGTPVGEIFLPELMKAAGYVTGLVGKWHLGWGDQFNPLNRGFDEFYGFLSGAHDYYNPLTGNNPVYFNNTPVEELSTGYLTHEFSDVAVNFIRRHRSESFFLYLAYNAVHDPLQAPTAPDTPPDAAARAIYGEMTRALDQGVGKVRQALKDQGIEDNTLLIFLSDNGGVFKADPYSDNAPLKAGKLFMAEGGIRVPFMAQWPGVIAPGSLFHDPVSSLDILATAVGVAGGRVPQDRAMDSVDLMPFITGQAAGAPHQALFWRNGPNYGTDPYGGSWRGNHAVRKGDWKLVRHNTNPPRLYDLGADIGETSDLAATYPDLVAQLTQEYNDWEAQLIAPAWGRRPDFPCITYEGEEVCLYI